MTSWFTGICCLICFVLAVPSLRAQDAVPDSALSVEKTAPVEKGESVRTVRGAVIRSSVFPGWGQWYNGQKLKAVLVLGCELGLIGAAVVQNQRAQDSTADFEREFYQDDRSSYLWYAAAFWLLSVIDAHVDAKLRDFDISEDLSFGAGVYSGQAVGLTVSYRF